MKNKQFGEKYIIRLEKGEELVATLKDFCREKNIKLGTVSGLGAADKIILGLFRTGTKEYKTREFLGDFEITSVLGNISQMDNDVYLHLHASIAKESGETFGGHLTSAVISATFEGIIEKIDGMVDRKYNENIGLNLYDF